jgi:hypothetical protein
MVGAKDHGLPSNTFWNMKKEAGFPINPPMDSPKARLKPTTSHKTLITPIAMKLCNIVEMMPVVHYPPEVVRPGV